MQIERLDHVNLRTTRLSEMIRWYEEVLGLTSGWRPAFPFAGAWLYAGEHPIVHLVEIDAPEAIGAETGLKLEHFALRANGRAAFETRMKERGEKLRTSELTVAGIVQINIWDPDGNHVHVDFALNA